MDVKITAINSIYKYKNSKTSWKNSTPRNSYILSYQLTGWYDHQFSFGTLSVKEDTLFLIDRDDTYTVTGKSQGESVCVTFTAETDLSTMILDCSDNPRVSSLFYKLFSLRNLTKKSNYYQAMSIIYEIIAIICQSKESEYVSSTARGKLYEVFDYISEHYNEPALNTSALSEIFGIGNKHLTNQFKKQYKTTPTQYIIDMRLNAAVELLSAGTHSISEIADAVGFSDVYYFSRLFKKRFSYPPSVFKSVTKQKKED